MKLEKINYEIQNEIRYITLDYQQNLNAIDETMAKNIIYALQDFENDDEVKVIVIKAAGRAFSSGGDINYFYNKVISGEEIELTSLASLVGMLALYLKKSTKIIITAVNGVAAGAGANFAFAGDFVIASEKAIFLESFVSVGLVPDTGGSFLLSKSLSPQQIMKYCVLGEPIMVQEAKELGLIYEVVAPEKLDITVKSLAERLTKGPLLCHKNIKKQIYEASFEGFEKYLKEIELPMLDKCGKSMDFQEGVRAFVEKRKSNFTGK